MIQQRRYLSVRMPTAGTKNSSIVQARTQSNTEPSAVARDPNSGAGWYLRLSDKSPRGSRATALGSVIRLPQSPKCASPNTELGRPGNSGDDSHPEQIEVGQSGCLRYFSRLQRWAILYDVCGSRCFDGKIPATHSPAGQLDALGPPPRSRPDQSAGQPLIGV